MGGREASDRLVELAPRTDASGALARRWFSSRTLDLIVWLDDLGAPRAFQLCYRKGIDERALTWQPETGYTHMAVDDGEREPLRHKGTPILVADGSYDPHALLRAFERAAEDLPADIRTFVSTKLRASGSHLR